MQSFIGMYRCCSNVMTIFIFLIRILRDLYNESDSYSCNAAVIKAIEWSKRSAVAAKYQQTNLNLSNHNAAMLISTKKYLFVAGMSR